MAINIFQGGSGKKAKINTASNSTRAQAAKSALVGASETSNSGSTAVKSSGTLSKVGDFIGKAAGIASKFLPGIGGTIASGISSLFNDPEWWQSVPGDAVTLNAPLKPTETGVITLDNGLSRESVTLRVPIVEFCLDTDGVTPLVMDISDQMLTQYLLPQVRKVVNAVPLQSAPAYREVLTLHATTYAIWRQLKKFHFMMQHGQTYLPSMNVAMFPVFQTENAAWLQSTINRLEEYLRANVRLPHTLCEYLAWRFGRVYKANDSAKSALVMYNAVSISASTNQYDAIIANLLNLPSSTVGKQQAVADMYNAYYEHDMMVEIREDTQFQYDTKEFMLRTNADFDYRAPAVDRPYNPVYIDSKLDNPTTFMASTVSTRGVGTDGIKRALFPIRTLTFYVNNAKDYNSGMPELSTVAFEDGQPEQYKCLAPTTVLGDWGKFTYQGAQFVSYGASRVEMIESMSAMIGFIGLCKSTEVYNKGAYIALIPAMGTSDDVKLYDFTSISMDMGLVPDNVLGNEHVYAFANLVDVDRKTSMSYAKAEKLIAKDVANVVEKLDIAAVQP